MKLDKSHHGETKLGKDNGLLLIIDPQNVNGVDLSKEDGHATISLDTLAPFSDNQEGDYAISDLRWMNGTESFMKLSNEENI